MPCPLVYILSLFPVPISTPIHAHAHIRACIHPANHPQVRYSYGVTLLSRADTILAPPAIISSTTTPSASILRVDTDKGGERTLFFVDFANEGEDRKHELRMHASSSTPVHSSSSTKRVAGQFTVSPTSSALSPPCVMSFEVSGAASVSSIGASRNGKGLQTQHTSGQGH
ncbi:hypothetical protein CVT25_008634 [Psilocybe cyanescens]|uniref:Uncharacterized protein n=1 Tax=Psilocybe cyanescens TaxID=93625 RepID=A0A409XDD9_PSICY|nr:hypothetical protein CVT25_008634 [Psilocybe cyanescens]